MYIDKKNIPYILKFDFKALRPQLIRPTIEEVRKQNKKDIVGVEIGVYKGLNSLSILNNLDIKRLYLIDCYKSYDEFIDTDMEKIKDIAIKNLKKHTGKIKFIFNTSENACSHIPDDLDFIYIDGNHEYEYVKKDIELYYPKIKQGGIIGGHDYPREGIVKALDEFGELYNHKRMDWWIKK